MTQTDPWGRRRRQLSSEETARLMLEAGVARVAAEGLRVNFDLVPLEEVIQAAGVSRAAVYRRWSTKDAYLADLLVELGRREVVITFGPADVAQAFAGLDAQQAVSSVESRRAALVQIIRQGVRATREQLATNRAFTTRLQLAISLMGLPESDYRQTLATIMDASDQHIVTSIADGYRTVALALGARPRHGLEMEDLAAMGSALLTGCAISDEVRLGDVPSLPDRDPFGIGVELYWTASEFAFTSLFVQGIEFLQQDEYLASDGPELLQRLC